MSRSVVIDSSVSASWCLPDEQSELSMRILKDAKRGLTTLHAPSLWMYEMTNILRSAVLRGRLTSEQATCAHAHIAAAPISQIDLSHSAHQGILALALAHGLTAYDATYLHVSLSGGMDLITADTHLLGLKHLFKFIRTPREY